MSPEILAYIPQRPPFIMIGEVVKAEETITQTSLTIPEDNIFVKNGFFTEPGLIENMAQTAGAGTGYKSKKDGRPMPGGYIAALKNVQILALPKAGDTILTETVFLQTLLSFHLVSGKITCGDKEIANCEFKIFVHTDQQK
jgi:3-hydroxymyristoyl/3-hydroxydecanoyl-(acyl carrier protein) dehydratase